MDNGELMVHALTKESADGLLTGDMDRRVTEIEGISALERYFASRKVAKGESK